MKKPSTLLVIGVIGALAAFALLGVLRWRASRTNIEAGFWYEDFEFSFSEEYTHRLGGPLTAPEVERIQRVSRSEVERAFQGLRIIVTDNRRAFWRVRVVRDIGPGLRMRNLPRSGESYALGMLGGTGSIGYLTIVPTAIHYAPHDADRQTVVSGIARGIGRAAVHEFGHMILGAEFAHAGENDSYEYESFDRAVQYYGDLRWTSAWPRLLRRFGP